jgi:glucan phosphoethanolaminetransferase (alkaline phosphatase superfamily)
VIAAFAWLCLPYLGLAVWLGVSRKPQHVAAFAASVLLLGWLLAIAARTWRRFFWLNAPFWLLAVAFCAYTLSYGDLPGELLAYVLATSSWEETRGFFGIWQGERLLLAAAYLAAMYCILAARSPATPISRRILRRRFALPGAALILGAFAASNPPAFIDGLAANPTIGTLLFIGGPLREARALVLGSGIQTVHYGAQPIGSREVHILIIGESARRDSWSVYGYSRPTTPNLDKLRGEAIFFQNAVADANVTICAVPILLTGMSPARFDMKAIRGNLVGLAGEAGYSTSWLMNQDPHISLLTGVHADRMLYPPSWHTFTTGRLPWDQVLLPEVKAELAGADRRSRFIGLHTIGSHWAYDSRYPTAFNRFGSGPALTYLDAVSGKPDQRVVDAYDNSVAYTDWFLGEIVAAARPLTVPVTITYVSDHGEDLFLLDGRSGHGAASYSKHQFDIPAFVWVNSAYREAHPDKVHALEENAGKEIRSHNVFYSVADLMGIRWPGERPAESFASPAFAADLDTPVIAGAGGRLVSPGD